MSEIEFPYWQKREPWIVVDPFFRREWLCPVPLRYYVHRNKLGIWHVIDRYLDLSVCSGPSRSLVVRRFYKLHRPIPVGESFAKKLEGVKITEQSP